MESETKLLTRDEIYLILINALVKKIPEPPVGWCASQYQRELWDMTEEYEPDPFLRQSDAVEKCLYYLVDFASRMPYWINVSETNVRVGNMCGDLADEIYLITREPETVIAKHGKIKAWLYAKLSVQTCWIYREETDRRIAEMEEAKRQQRISPLKKDNSSKNSSSKWQSALAKEIFQKVCDKQNSSAQPTLF